MQCLGRLVAKETIYFDGAATPRLHRNKPLLFLLPKQCSNTQDTGDLCVNCNSRNKATRDSLEKREGKYIPNQACLLHGTIIEPIPDWSRLYKGGWWNKQVENGYTLSEETLKRAEAYKDAEQQIDMKQVDASPKPKVRMTRKRITAVPNSSPQIILPPVVPVVVKAAAPVVKAAPIVLKAAPVIVKAAAPVPVPVTPVTPVKKERKAPKKAPTKEVTPQFKVTNTIPLIPLEEIEIEVERTEINGRAVWLNKAKDKVYDLKYNYIGRKKDDTIDSSFPDSDRE